MRILHVIPSLEVGGAETMLARLVRECATDSSYSMECTVVCLDRGGPYQRQIEDLGVRVHVLAGKPLFTLRALIKVIRTYRPDIVQTWMYRADLMGLLASQLAGHGKVVWNLRCSYGWANRGIARHMVFNALRILSRLPCAIVSNTSRAIEEHRDAGYRARCWNLIPNGFDTNAYSPDLRARARLRAELGLAKGALIVGMIARFDPLKDHMTFLRAAKRLLEEVEDVHFVLVGARLEENLAGTVMDLQLQDYVHILGYRSDVADIMPGFDIASLSSVSEGFPNVVGEAMACGLPCVSTRVGDVAELLDPEWIVEPGDERALAGKWKALLAMAPTSRRAIGAKNRERIIVNYSIEAVADSYRALYEAIISPSQ